MQSNIDNNIEYENKNIENKSENIEWSVTFVMDKSGSMTSMGIEHVDGLNNFYETQKKTGKFKSTLIYFNAFLIADVSA